MCFAAPELVTSLVTTHLPLARVPRALTPSGVRDADGRARAACSHALGKQPPDVAVASLNPHAGESGLLGDEETTRHRPGHRARRSASSAAGARSSGPSAPRPRIASRTPAHYDGVVAMYHDQATIPMKLVAFGDAVNVTLGLTVVRTSVDHGTAYDIAWTGQGRSGGMIAAMKLAERSTSQKAIARWSVSRFSSVSWSRGGSNP